MKTRIGVLVLEGEVELDSPALIGSGRSDESDMDLLLDSKGLPFIPATSLVGVLRSRMKCAAKKNMLEKIWGYMDDNGLKSSALFCSDLGYIQKPDKKYQVSIRDGICIDPINGMVKKGTDRTGSKYDYQVLEPGISFKLHMEIEWFNETEKDFVQEFANTVCGLMERDDFAVGGHTANGLGRIRLVDPRMKLFDFSNKIDILHWLINDFKNMVPVSGDQIILDAEKRFVIRADFILKTSLISRAYTEDPAKPDAVHISSHGKPVFTGSSWKGAIRGRAQRILRTLGKDDSLIKKLFGFVDIDGETEGNAHKGMVKLKETILPDFKEELQSRIRIDRFTGGVMEGALFDSMPLFADNDKEKIIKLEMSIDNYSDEEAGLLLLVLKDLWTGDLALGGEKGIGRGVLNGVKADISWKGKEVTVKKDESGKGVKFERDAEKKDESGKGVKIERDIDELENFVKALNRKGGET